MRVVAQASVDYTGVEHLRARPSKQDPQGVVVWSEIQPIIAALETKLDLAHLEIEQNKKFASTIKRFDLTDGIAEVRTSDVDNEDYTFTTFRIPTGFKDNAGNPTMDFEDFALSSTLQQFSNEGFAYEFHKEPPDFAVVVFQSIVGAFPDNRVRISLILIPEGLDIPLEPTEPALVEFLTNFQNWTVFNDRFGAGSWNRVYRGINRVNGAATIHFANGNTITQAEADAFYAAQDLGSVDRRAGLAA